MALCYRLLPVVRAVRLVLPEGNVSGEASYDVYVKKGVDSMGRDEFSEAVAHFVERANAVALKRRLVARGRRCTSRGASSTASAKRRRNGASRITPKYQSTVSRRITAPRRGLPRTPRKPR